MTNRLKASAIFFLCFAKFFVSGKANKKIENPKKIIVMQMAKLGDMVCTTPMFRAIKEKYPGAKVFVIGNSVNKELLAGNPDVDGYFVYKNNFWELVSAVKKEKIDFACTTHPNFWGLAMLYLAEVKLISVPTIRNGFSPVETKLYKMLRKFVIAMPHYMGSYVPREYLRLLEPLGIFSENTKKYLFFSKQSKNSVENFFAKNNVDLKKDFIVGISPSVGNKIRKWGGKNFAEVADYIYKNYKAIIIIIGAKNDENEVKEMMNNISCNTKVINTYNFFNIDELKVVISQLSLLISVESGPIFIAETFDVPTINLVGPVDESAQSPKGKHHLIIKINKKKRVIHVMNSTIYDEKEARYQIENITIKMVTDKIDEIVPKIYDINYN